MNTPFEHDNLFRGKGLVHDTVQQIRCEIVLLKKWDINSLNKVVAMDDYLDYLSGLVGKADKWNPNINEGYNDITNIYIALYHLHNKPFQVSSSATVSLLPLKGVSEKSNQSWQKKQQSKKGKRRKPKDTIPKPLDMTSQNSNPFDNAK
eukprot:12637205-Ditylum_brightwellii.AAC.1